MTYLLVKGSNLRKLVIPMIWKIVKEKNINKKILLKEISKKINVPYFTIKPQTINDAIKAFNNRFPKDNKNKISITDVLKIMIHNKKSFVWNITNKLIKENGLHSLSYTPIKMYLYVLENQANIIKSQDKLVKFNRSSSKSKLYSLNQFSDWRIPNIHISPEVGQI